MIRFFYLFLVTLSFVFYGCGGSKVPITELSEAISDDRVVGNWTEIKSGESESGKLTVYKFNEKEYLLWSRFEKKDSTETKFENDFYRFYISKISNKYFVNVQNIDSTSATNRLYYFYKYEFLSDSMVQISNLHHPSKSSKFNVDDFNDSEALYNFIRKNIQNSKLYIDTTKIIKMK